MQRDSLGHESDVTARLFGRHLLGHFRNRRDHYFFGSLHLAVLPGETILDGYYTGFINDVQIVAKPWGWVRVDPLSINGVDLAEIRLGDPRQLYETLTGRTHFDGPMLLELVTSESVGYERDSAADAALERLSAAPPADGRGCRDRAR